jgi:outer membrane protein OmpA-like peptidoglycan-associated protein/flagellar hook assembly protein FlgD
MTTKRKTWKMTGKRLLTLFPGIIVLWLVLGCATTADDVPEPQVRIDGEDLVYISPAASPGVNDYFSAVVHASAGGEAALMEQEIRVTDEDGVMVYLATAAEKPVPEAVVWNGRDSLGNFVAEGRYVLTVTVTDDLGQAAESDPVTIVVDNTSPEADVGIAYNVFSPDGDVRPVLPIQQSGGGALMWSGSILDDEGTRVRHWNWDAELPEEIEWDGRDNEGQQVEDGRYSYLLRGEDAAGNQTVVTQENIRVDTAAPSVRISANRRHFSPTESGVRDTVSFETRVPEELEVVEWTFSVLDEDDHVVTTESADGSVPEALRFTGRSDGDALPEGAYRGRLDVVYRNGEREDTASRPVTLDVTPPSASVSLASDQFSPDGEEGHRSLTIEQESDGAVEWTGRIIPEDEDESILSRTWEDELEETFTWNGQTESGESAASGRYRYVLSARDRAGNGVSVESGSFLLDRDGPALDVAIEPTPFNPGAENEKELAIHLSASDRTGLEHWNVRIRDPEGNDFTRIEGDGEPPETVAWDGRSDDGELPQSLRDYTAMVTVTNEVGNRSTRERTVPIGLLVEIDEAGDTRFRLTGIRFVPFEADFSDLDDQEALEQNQETLDTVAQYLSEFPDQNVLIEGHAVHIFFSEERARREQEEVLLPLSEERAEAIRDALVERGIDEDRLATKGFGGSEPVVPHDDMENRWKNRRVEFVLVD